jgi:hypothetical protein
MLVRAYLVTINLCLNSTKLVTLHIRVRLQRCPQNNCFLHRHTIYLTLEQSVRIVH